MSELDRIRNQQRDTQPRYQPAPDGDQAHEAWDRTLTDLRHAVGEQLVAVWLGSCQPVGIRDGRLGIGADPQIVGWLNDRWGRITEQCAGMPIVFVALAQDALPA